VKKPTSLEKKMSNSKWSATRKEDKGRLVSERRLEKRAR